MKKILSISLIFFLFTSCNLKEKLQEISKKLEIINSDLRKQFNHEKIYSDIGWGTSEGSNYVEVTFYEFNMDSKNHSELEVLSNKVIQRLVLKNPKFKEKEFIEIRFTNKQQSDEINSFTKFRVNFNNEF